VISEAQEAREAREERQRRPWCCRLMPLRALTRELISEIEVSSSIISIRIHNYYANTALIGKTAQRYREH
jgi:hypothetical protein